MMLLVYIVTILYIYSTCGKTRAWGARYHRSHSSALYWSEYDDSSDSDDEWSPPPLQELEWDVDDYYNPLSDFNHITVYEPTPGLITNLRNMATSADVCKSSILSRATTSSESEDDLDLAKAKIMLSNILAEAKRNKNSSNNNNNKAKHNLPCLASTPDDIIAPPRYWGQNGQDMYAPGYRPPPPPAHVFQQMAAVPFIYGGEDFKARDNQVAYRARHPLQTLLTTSTSISRIAASNSNLHSLASRTCIPCRQTRTTSKVIVPVTRIIGYSTTSSDKIHSATGTHGPMEKIGKTYKWFHKLAKDVLFN